MKQQLWILNSALLGLFVAVLIIMNFISKEPPILKISRAVSTELEKKLSTATPLAIEKIYQNDLFETYVATESKPIQQSLIVPVPEPKIPPIAIPPETPKSEFIQALTLTVKGIIASSNEQQNVAMIADETNKEALYHLGDKIKDAEIIKIARDRVVLLRANGQLEVFYLRKDDNTDPNTPDKWKEIIRKIDEQNIEIDPFTFVKEVDSLGAFLEKASISGTAYFNGLPVGMRVGTTAENELASQLGLKQDDVITAVNNFSCVDLKNRMEIYDKIVQTQVGENIKVSLKRANNDMTMTYKLARISKAKKPLPPGVKEGEDALKMSRLQEREKSQRDFDKQHEQRQEETIMEIRRRILENLRNRMRDRRER
jgi:type II secretion system protein C